MVDILQNGSGANVAATFATQAAEAALPNSRRIAAGTGISLTDGGAGSTLTIANTGDITSANLLGTANQIVLSGSGTGVLVGTTNITLSLPQSIATGSAVQFGSLGLGAAVTGAEILSLTGSGTITSASGAVWNADHTLAATATISGSTNITTAAGFNLVQIERPTLSAASALTVTNAATFTIINAPAGGGAGPATITNAFSLWVQAGLSKFDGASLFGGGRSSVFLAANDSAIFSKSVASDENSVYIDNPNATAPIATMYFSTANFSGTSGCFIRNTDSSGQFLFYAPGSGGIRLRAAHASGTIQFYTGSVQAGQVTSAGLLSWAPSAQSTGTTALVNIASGVNTGGAVPYFSVTGAASTGQTASTEIAFANFNLAQTVQWATGALTTERAFLIQAPTLAFVGASTVTTSVTASVTAAPTAGTNATITNSFALQVGGSVTIGATAAGTVYGAIDIPAHTVTVTGTTQVTSTGFAGIRIAQITITDASAVTVNNGASLYIANAPVAAGSVTLTNAYAIWIDAGVARFDGNLDFSVSDSTNVVLGTTTGTKIGTATTQKLAFFNATPVVQEAGTNDVLASLVTLGLRAASSNPPLNLGTGALTAGASTLGATTVTTLGTAGLVTLADGNNIAVGTTTGTKIGTATTQKVAFFNSAPVVQQTDGATLTNNVTAGGTDNTIANYTDLATYSNDAAAIRNDIYQLARKVKITTDALRSYGLLS